MFKKALKIAITFGVLLAAHVGYVRLFAIVARRALESRGPAVVLVPTTSRTMKEAMSLAKKGFGEGHWTDDPDLQVRYYNKERGYWMYAKNYERRADGKQLRFTPFALIWMSQDGKVMKTVTSDEAIVDLDRPLGLASKPGTEAMRVVHAQITGDVRIRDDKGTEDRGDDLVIGPMPYLEYDEPTLQVRSDSSVVMQDREMWVNGYGLLIQLRPKEVPETGAPAAGFDGAKTLYLRRNVHIILNDVGRSGFLTGQAQAEQVVDGRTPMDIRNAGQLQIDLPKPRIPVRVGPPAPQGPTLAQFSTDVVVLRGRPNQAPDQLNCDHLRLTLLPGEKSPPPGPPAKGPAPGPNPPTAAAPVTATAPVVAATATATGGAPDDSGDSLGGLTLRRAVATGHAVWLQSVSQGTKAMCKELIYKKLAPENPDETYLRTDPEKTIWVEKQDIVQAGPNKGKPKSITTIRTIDATIFDNGQGSKASTIVARGPGQLETRPARDKPVERRALWRDELVMRDELDHEKLPVKRITLTGDPRFVDVGQATLDSKKEIIVWLRPKAGPEVADANATANPGSSPSPSPAATTAAATDDAGSPSPSGPATPPGGGSYEIDKLRATVDVHLTTPGRNMTADEELVAVFENRPAAEAPEANKGDAATAPRAKAVAVADAPAPASANANVTPDGAAGGPATAAAGAPAVAAATPEKPKPTEPEVNVRAERVWARLTIHPKSGPKGADGGTVAVANANANANARVAGADPGPGRGAEGEPGEGEGEGEGEKGRTEIQEVRLRGAVAFHQDPEPGKRHGTTVTGEAVDVTNLGDNRMYFKVYLVDPFKTFTIDQATKLTPERLQAMMKALGQSVPLARVETDDFSVEGPIIGLDQRTHEAWVDGRGVLVQMASRNLLTDDATDDKAPPTGRDGDPARSQAQAQAQAKARPVDDAKMTPMTITWNRSMQFHGVSTNPQGVPVGRAQFFGDVKAHMEDALMVCQELTTYMDKVVPLNQPRRKKGDPATTSASAAPAEPKPQIALIDCLRKVVVISRKVDPESPTTILQQQRIEGEHLIYEKLTGRFVVPGAGQVWLYSRKGQDSLAMPMGPASAPAGAGEPPATAARRPIVPTANPTTRVAPNTRRATEVVGRSTTPGLVTKPADAAKGKDKAKGKEKEKAGPPLPPLELTQVTFDDEMHGRFGTGKGADTIETRWANFFGDVQVLHSVVPNVKTSFNFDNPPLEGTYLTAQTVSVVSEPPPPGTKDPARNFLKAWENANAVTIDTTIQADKITFDSHKDLFYAYGDHGRDVQIVQQKNAGMGYTTARGTAAWYNRKTGESQVVDPKTFQLVDAKTGIRPAPIKLPDPKKAYPKPLTPVKPPTRSYFERKGFNGR